MPRKAKPPSAQAQWAQRAKLVEEFALLDQEIANFKPRIFRHQKLRELIMSWYPGQAPEEEVVVPGTNCDIVVSARDKIRAVTAQGKQKLFKLWGSAKYIANSSVLLKSLPDPKDELGLYTVQALTGPRHLRVTAKPRSAAGSSSAAA
ncbi:MAG TPA: hypothetical protein VGG62_10685 [Terracidiphilus sp.]